MHADATDVPLQCCKDQWSRKIAQARRILTLSARSRSLYQRLHELRERLAAEASLPVLRIFSNEQLLDLAELEPRTPAELTATVGALSSPAQEAIAARLLALLGADEAEAFEERWDDREGDGDELACDETRGAQ